MTNQLKSCRKVKPPKSHLIFLSTSDLLSFGLKRGKNVYDTPIATKWFSTVFLAGDADADVTTAVNSL